MTTFRWVMVGEKHIVFNRVRGDKEWTSIYPSTVENLTRLELVISSYHTGIAFFPFNSEFVTCFAFAERND